MKVLIPVDGSEQALHTIETAASVLDKPASRIYLLNVRVPVATEASWTMTEDEVTAAMVLSKARASANASGFQVEKAEHTLYPDAATAICEYADEIGADLIVIGSHGYQGITRFLMGSVSEKVFREARQPVILVRNDKAHTVEISHFEQAGMHQAAISLQ